MHRGCYESTTGKKISDDGGSAIWANVMQPFDRPGEPVCFNDNIRIAFTGLLMALQVLTVIWFGMIIRVAYGVISGKGAQDSRSDDEDEGEEEEIEEIEYEEKIATFDGLNDHANHQVEQPIEEEVDAESLNLGLRKKNGSSSMNGNTPRRSSRRTGAGRATALSIPGHGDRKELLGRIGCDKPS
jgi:very-long-chain ceramide synthase